MAHASRPRRCGSPWSPQPGDQRAHPHDAGTGLKIRKHVLEVINAREVLDDNPLHAQVVSPDALDEFGVVAALHEIRLGSATRARASSTANDPDAVRCGEATTGVGFTSSTADPSIRNRVVSGKARTAPRRSSRWTRPPPCETIAPVKPLVASSTTSPRSTGTAVGRLSPREIRKSARTSCP